MAELDTLLDLMLLMVPSLDYITDILVLIFFRGEEEVNMIYATGLAFFVLSQYLRLVFVESLVFAGASDGGGVGKDPPLVFWDDEDYPNFCGWLILMIFGIPIGVFVIVERILRFVLCVADPVLAIGYAQATGRCEFLVRDKLFVLTRAEKDFFSEQPWYMRYIHTVLSMTCGSRWQAIVRFKWMLENPGDYNLKTLKGSATFCTKMAIVEECLQNVGGLFMSGSALSMYSYYYNILPEVNGLILLIASLTLTVISILFETGYYIGRLHQIPSVDYNVRPTSSIHRA